MRNALKPALTLLFAVILSLPASAAGNPAPDAEVNAKAAVVVEAMTGRELYSQNADERLPNASTTKIMTALLTLEEYDIDAVFTVDSDAIKIEGSSMGLQTGDQVSLRTLAAGMLLSSGNDAANAAAVRIAGSVPAFVARMNARAKELGLFDTAFVTPSGLDAEGHYSTAADMARLARAALENGEFAAICSQYKLRVKFGDPPYERWLTNHNKLLNYYDGTVGVKTGYTKKAGRCLVSAAVKDGVTLICVTLGCPDDWNVHQQLYDRCFQLVELRDLSPDATGFAVPVTGGTKSEVLAKLTGPAEVPVPVGAKIEYRPSVEPFVYAPVRKGAYLGEIKVMVDSQQVWRITLTAGEDIPLLYEYKEKKTVKDILSEFFDRLFRVPPKR